MAPAAGMPENHSFLPTFDTSTSITVWALSLYPIAFLIIYHKYIHKISLLALRMNVLDSYLQSLLLHINRMRDLTLDALTPMPFDKYKLLRHLWEKHPESKVQCSAKGGFAQENIFKIAL